jgi:conjugal transfer pilus assembly protein TraK
MMRMIRFAFMLQSLLLAAPTAFAETKQVIGDSVTIDVPPKQMSRLFVRGQKIASVRSLDEPTGPQVLVQHDATTGEVFIGFDDDPIDGHFSLFVTTDAGQTFEVRLHPLDGADNRIELVSDDGPSLISQQTQGAGSGYSETITAFMKLMFNGQVTQGVSFTPVKDQGEVSAHLLIKTIGYYQAEGLRGIVLNLTNQSLAPTVLQSDPFLVKHVLAVGISRETLGPKESAYVYVVETMP